VFKSISVTVPAKRQEENPLSTIVKLCDGTLSRVVVRPPPGPNWEVYFKLMYRETSILPVEELEWIPLEQYPVDATLNWSEWDGTYDVNVLFCSPDARFEHTIVVDFEVDEKPSLVKLFTDFVQRGF